MKKLIISILLWSLSISFSYAITKIDIDSDNNQKVDGAAESYSTGWNGDVDAPQKNDIYDYLINFDADADGSFLDETWLTGNYQPLDSDLTALAALTTTSYGRALLEVANEAAFKALVNLEAGTDYQAWSATLDTLAAISYSANMLTFFAAADYAGMKSQLDTDDIQTLTGISAGTSNLGTFTGTTITDSSTIKAALQELETEVELKFPLTGGTITGTTYIDDGAGDSPIFGFINGSDNYWRFVMGSTDEFNLYTNSATDKVFWIYNGGAGKANLFLGGSIELNNLVDTTISRASAGDISIEGNIVYRAGGTEIPDSDVANDIILTNISQVQDITSTAAELNALDGIPATLTATEIGYNDGVTSGIQAQIDGKEPTVTEGSLADNVIITADIKDDEILEADLDATNAPTDNYILSYDLATLGFTWVSAGSGDVVGPSSSTDNAIAKFDSTTGKLIQEEADFIVDDNGVVNPSDAPTIKGYHNTDAESVWSLGAVDADVNTATGDTTSRWKTLVGNSLTTFLSMNGTNETLDIAKPIVPSKGIGTPYEINPTSPVTIDSTICRKIFTVATSTTFNLPAEVECSTGYAKEFCFKARGTATITLNPDDADFMQFGDNASGGAGKYLVDDSGTRGDYICIFGRDSGGTDYWTDLSSIPDSAQATTWSYEP